MVVPVNQGNGCKEIVHCAGIRKSFNGQNYDAHCDRNSDNLKDEQTKQIELEKSPCMIWRGRGEKRFAYEGDGDEQLEPVCCPSSRVMVMPSEEAA